MRTVLGDLDEEARLRHLDRSKLISIAVERLLVDRHQQTLEDQHHQGYERQAVAEPELSEWEALQRWPESG